MPIGFWNDPEGKRYHDAYFAKYPNVWCHGDYVELTECGGMIIYGRSDAVLNPGGVRIGTAEIYRQVEQLDEVLESLVIGQDWNKDVRVVLFVKLRAILSTGSPLAPESFDYVYRDIKADVCLSSISGGTDIISCFVLGNPVLPVYRGEIQCRGLGMKVEVYDEDGSPVHGKKGELVCLSRGLGDVYKRQGSRRDTPAARDCPARNTK